MTVLARRPSEEFLRAPDRGLNWHRGGNPVCLGFAYAGSGGSVLAPVLNGIPNGFGLAEAVLPGRGRRFNEAAPVSLEQICEEGLAQVRRFAEPPLLFGYSLGALLVYRLAEYLTAHELPPRGLVVCALDAPHRRRPPKGVHRYDLSRLRRHLADLGGTAPEILNDDEALRCFAPAIQNDYRLLETDRQTQTSRLSCPVLAIAGRDDAETTVDGVRAWRELTHAAFDEAWLSGGHFFLHTHGPALTRCLRDWIDTLDGC